MLTMRPLQHALGYLLDAILPHRCLGCAEMIDGEASLCAECWRRLTLIGPPFCRCCGYPLPQVVADAPLCGVCAVEPPLYDRARTALRYDDGSRGMILRFKHADRTDIALTFGRLMLNAGRDLLADADLITPVPLHRWRLLQRGYNQAAMLAQALHQASGVPLAPDLIQRIAPTRSQQGLSGDQRQRNITSTVFRLHPWHRSKAEGKRILLIDDVLTTGATVTACVRSLQREGAEAVDVLTLARVVRDAGETISALGPDRVDCEARI
jgi:ComF family protein